MFEELTSILLQGSVRDGIVVDELIKFNKNSYIRGISFSQNIYLRNCDVNDQGNKKIIPISELLFFGFFDSICLIYSFFSSSCGTLIILFIIRI